MKPIGKIYGINEWTPTNRVVIKIIFYDEAWTIPESEVQKRLDEALASYELEIPWDVVGDGKIHLSHAHPNKLCQAIGVVKLLR
jgi:hypothetical protein